MKVAIIIRFLTKTGGAQREVLMLAREFRKRGNDVTVYTFVYDKENCFPGEFRDIKIKTLDFEFSERLKRLFRIPFVGGYINRFADNQKAKKLSGLIDSDTEILNPHDQISVHTAYYAKKHYPHMRSVWMMNDLDIARWSIFDHPILGRPSRPFYKRFIAWLRDRYENHKFFRSQDGIGVIVQSMGERAKKYLGRDDAVVVRSGVDLEQFSYKERKSISGKRIKIYCQGMFYVYRRFEDVIRAVALLRERGYDPELLIIGDYGHKDTARAYYDALRALVRELRLEDRVTFAGVVSKEDLARAYQDQDIFVFACIQTWGIAIFEAMASGLPVILSRAAGAGEMLEDRKTMLVAETGDPEDIARAIEELVKNSELYNRLSVEGNRFVRENLSWPRYAENMLKLFKSVLGKRS